MLDSNRRGSCDILTVIIYKHYKRCHLEILASQPISELAQVNIVQIKEHTNDEHYLQRHLILGTTTWQVVRPYTFVVYHIHIMSTSAEQQPLP